MKHYVAKQAANEMALKGVDKEFIDQRTSLAVVTISDEESEIDILATSSVWPGNFCAPSIVVKATCLTFQAELEVSEKARRMHQWYTAPAVLTLPGAGRAGSVRDCKPARPNRERDKSK